MNVKGMFVGVSALMIAGCMSGVKVDPTNSSAVTAAVVVKHDEFQKMTSFQGPDANPDLADETFLRAWKDDESGVMEYQIYFSDLYGGEWAFFKSAYDSDGNEIPLVSIVQKVMSCGGGSCSHKEDVGLKVSRKYLEAHKEGGARFKVSGTGGEAIFAIPGSYVQGFLNAVK